MEPSVPLSRSLFGTGCYPAGWTLPSAIECCELQLFIQDRHKRGTNEVKICFPSVSATCWTPIFDSTQCVFHLSQRLSPASLFIFSFNNVIRLPRDLNWIAQNAVTSWNDEINWAVTWRVNRITRAFLKSITLRNGDIADPCLTLNGKTDNWRHWILWRSLSGIARRAQKSGLMGGKKWMFRPSAG